MDSFSVRMGLSEPRALAQTDSLDEETRIALWNVVHAVSDFVDDKWGGRDHDRQLARSLWVGVFKSARDEAPYISVAWTRVKRWLIEESWSEALEVLEEVLLVLESSPAKKGLVHEARNACNQVFANHLVGYRFVEERLVPLDSEVEVEAVRNAIAGTGNLPGARHHLERSLALLSDRENRDCANVIKEAILAVESVVKVVTGAATLGAGLKKLKDAGLVVHPALEGAWLKMYGWTSDDEGIRHAAIDKATADLPLAKYMLVACSAFVTYLTDVGTAGDRLSAVGADGD